MCVYLAARYRRREELQQYAAELRAAGVEVVSTWLDEIMADYDGRVRSAADAVAIAYRDLYDLGRADTIVLFTDDPADPASTGGKDVEWGYALSPRYTKIVVGPRSNVFTALADRQYYGWPGALEIVGDRHEERY